ncbi:MAG: glycosyltransferase [Saprospiraceae bacterium]|nr:glycosyltransferase [Saprospiraceae bacterium]
MKILHIIENFDNGAVEKWLFELYSESKIIKPDWDWTFYCLLPEKGKYEHLVLESGAKVVHSPITISHKFLFLKELRKFLSFNRFNIIHVHHDYLSGFYLLSTILLKNKKRIILHLHNQERSLPTSNIFIKKMGLFIFRKLSFFISDEIWANSYSTLHDFINMKHYSKDMMVFELGLNLNRFNFTLSKNWLKQEAGISNNSKILLFVGRMYSLKNPLFCIDIINELLKLRDDTYLFFVGEGELYDVILRNITENNLTNRVRLLGFRNDVYDIMFGGDLLLFPRIESPKEGFGLNILEAQTVGIPSLTSFGVPQDVVQIPSLVEFYSIENSSKQWARKVSDILNAGNKIKYPHTLKIMEESNFNIKNGALKLIQLYTKYS